MIKGIIIFLALFFVSGVCFSGSGTTSGLVFFDDLGARSIGLSGACGSLIKDVTLIRSNPASIAGMNPSKISFLYYNDSMIGTSYGSMVFGQKIGLGYFAINISYLNSGIVELNYPDESKNSVIGESDIAGGFSFAMRLSNELSAGMTLKVLYSNLAGLRGSSSAASDAGIIFTNFIIQNFNIGIALTNIGGGLKYIDTVEALSLSARAGISYSIDLAGFNILLAADGLYGVNDKTTSMMAGAEIKCGSFAVRAGAPLKGDTDTYMSAGFGFCIGNLELDYGAVLGKTLDIMHKVSLGIKFEIKDTAD